MPRTKATLNKKIRLYKEQQGRCYWCDRTMRVPMENPASGAIKDPLSFTLDHVYSKKYGEESWKKNKSKFIASCYECNHMRGSGLHNERDKFAKFLKREFDRDYYQLLEELYETL